VLEGAQKNTATSCDLEQYVVNKGGSTVCVVGSCYKYMPWSNLAGDYLFLKMLSNHKYKKVLCINLDRRMKDLMEIYHQACLTDEEIPSEKLMFLSGHDVLPEADPPCNIVDHIMTLIEKEISSVKGKEPFGIFLYSLSEVILSLGVLLGTLF
jgi:hypothetical protein